MFDLNLTLDSSDGHKLDANNCDGWSREASPANGGVESSSSNDDACSRRAAASALNFDRGLTSSESALVTRDLFPLSRLSEPAAFSSPRVAVQQEVQQVQVVQARKSRRGPRSRSSQYRGVTFYRRTGRWESHIWDCGKQVYLGGFDTALAAARAYDRAAIKFRGVEADINFNHSDYDDMKPMMNLSKEEFVQALRKQSNVFSRGSCKYRAQNPGIKAYDKGAIMCNGEMTLEPRYDKSQHDLNLNLGMPASACSPKESGWLDSLKLHLGSSASNGGVPVRSRHPSLNPQFVPNNEERETSASQLEVGNLGERVHGHYQTAANSTAASSRFSSEETARNTLASYPWINPYLPPS